MCGIAGFWDPSGIREDEAEKIARRMAESLHHRGPDDRGIWLDAKEGLAFAHARLAVVDLSAAGKQPMASQTGRYIIVFNGEIYNHLELRKRIETASSPNEPNWRGHSDTETLLGYLELYGLQKTLRDLVGMFAFAVFDRKNKKVYLARDRLGEKPLYYGNASGKFFFASEPKAIRQIPDFSASLDIQAVALYFKHNYIPAPHSIHKDLKKLPPGCFVELAEETAPVHYWNVAELGCELHQLSSPTSNDNLLNELDRCLIEAVSLQMVSDVPSGAFLSGGIDSSLIVALMQECSERPVSTFSIGFDDKKFNEAEYAREIAQHLGTNHTELYVSSRDALDVIPKLPSIFCEPFSDSSQIPTFLVSKMAREHVTVCLSGDGADELFGGYNRYSWVADIWNKSCRIPMPARKLISHAMTAFSPDILNMLTLPLLSALPKRFHQLNPGDRIHKLASIITSESPLEIYETLISHWQNPSEILMHSQFSQQDYKSKFHQLRDISFVEQMMLVDMQTYLPDDILVKVDRAAMAVSLETRTPFLDHRVVQSALSMPFDLKVRNGERKWCLKQLLQRRVPPLLFERPKTGFGVPLGDWLRGELKDWAEFLLDDRRLKQRGLLRSEPIQKKWREHKSGTRNWEYLLWDVLMLEAWLENEDLSP